MTLQPCGKYARLPIQAWGDCCVKPDQKEKTTTVTKYTVIEIDKKFCSLELFIYESYKSSKPYTTIN